MHPRLEIPAGVALALVEAVEKSVRAGAQVAKDSARPSSRGQTLRPGTDTPLWNALAAAVRTEMKAYGDQARLGRLLGLSRQRVHEFLHGTGGMPDAERTLLLLAWLHARATGTNPA